MFAGYGGMRVGPGRRPPSPEVAGGGKAGLGCRAEGQVSGDRRAGWAGPRGGRQAWEPGQRSARDCGLGGSCPQWLLKAREVRERGERTGRARGGLRASVPVTQLTCLRKEPRAFGGVGNGGHRPQPSCSPVGRDAACPRRGALPAVRVNAAGTGTTQVQPRAVPPCETAEPQPPPQTPPHPDTQGPASRGPGTRQREPRTWKGRAGGSCHAPNAYFLSRMGGDAGGLFYPYICICLRMPFKKENSAERWGLIKGFGRGCGLS